MKAIVIRNRVRTFVFQLLSAAAFAASAGTASAQTNEPRTVADFLRAVPERYTVGYDRRMREELLRGERRGVVVDIANGYISYDESDNPSGFELALFRRSDGSYLVAYSTGAFHDLRMGQELGNWPTLVLLSYEGRGRWRDVTRATLPVAFNRRLAYKLPRRGRRIEAWDERGCLRHTLTWTNDRFRYRGPGRRPPRCRA
ncbi:MAG: hypothetical protein AVDCRST_MAG68-4897 [uncultured Gemmatimonadetes bacterium]|uniref:Uncharacterized protein n=1 Tax=uncultured Gemmatimonadota bacterium TaxID=203437 RepID=A0A6J4MWL0_9BACT|nr:MAG: hypothetical protein AVDCRST_MAG68-4897 [uncultured Gemmatimonadota bacterium]